tara:strand:- start:190 stop:294 length:105 start_codon:yes stop_codon:yes gene_type:complete
MGFVCLSILDVEEGVEILVETDYVWEMKLVQVAK